MFSFKKHKLQSPFGEPVEPEKAPEAISKAVASLPPEQMFELMKQMKVSHSVLCLPHSHTLCIDSLSAISSTSAMAGYAAASETGRELFSFSV